MHIHWIYFFFNLYNKKKWVILSGFYGLGNWILEKILAISPFLVSLIPPTITNKKIKGWSEADIRIWDKQAFHLTQSMWFWKDFNDKSLPPDHMSGPSESLSQILKAYAKSQEQQWWGWVIWKQHLTGSSVLVNPHNFSGSLQPGRAALISSFSFVYHPVSF